MNIPISHTLTQALVRDGWWKLAAEVRRRQGDLAADEPTIPNLIAARAMKVASDHANEDVILEGLAAYRQIKEAP